MTDLSKAIELKPGDPVLYNTRGGLYNVMGEYAKALNDFDKAIEADTSNAEAYCRKGVAYLYLGVYDKAIEYMEKGVRLDASMEDNVKDYLKEAKEKLSKKKK
jgi:tetratricopeptide (TPR) repeat protein